MSDLPPEELVKALRDESLALQRTAWSRPDGGQDCSISANLADQAAALIELLEAREDTLTDIIRRFMRASDDKGHINEPAIRAAYERASEALRPSSLTKDRP